MGEEYSYVTFVYAIALGSTPRRIREAKMARQTEDFPTLDISTDKNSISPSIQIIIVMIWACYTDTILYPHIAEN